MAHEAVLLHNYPEYLDECCELLNEEWPRSGTLRLESLKKSCDVFPCSIILLADESDQKNEGSVCRRVLVGHSRLARVLGRPKACWIESVIVRMDRRCQGFGKILMTKTEQYAVKLGFVEAHLSTRDKLEFYAKLGYEHSMQPVCVSTASSSLMSNGFFNKLESCDGLDFKRKEVARKVKTEEDVKKEKGIKIGSPAPTPPPPPPLPISTKLVSKPVPEIGLNQTWMVKYLT